MTVASWLFAAMKKLSVAGVDSPRRDAFVLAEDKLGKDRTWINAHGEYELTDRQFKELNKLLKRRINREPLAYIRGKAWFYGRFFIVSPAVMIPRPESESIIQIIKDLRPKSIVDIGTGSGALAITLALEVPGIKTIAVDSSPAALLIAKMNAKKHYVNVIFKEGSLLEPILSLNALPDVVVANLPYVPNGLITSPEINHEPPKALFSGSAGLDHYTDFFGQFAKYPQLKSIKYILTESLESQHKEIEKLAASVGYRVLKTDILVQLFVKTF